MGLTTMPLIASGVQAGVGLLQQGMGMMMRRKAQKWFNKNKYQIPSGINKMLDVARGVASQREMPGSDIQRNRLQATTMQGVESATRAARSSSDVLGVLQGLFGRQMESQNSLAYQNAQNWQSNQYRYAQTLGTLGEYESQKWQYNVLYPYMQKMEAAGQMAMAGSENMASGIGGGMESLYANQVMQQDQKMYDQWYNQKVGSYNYGLSPYLGYNRPNVNLGYKPNTNILLR